jgi:hypothetical protein
MQWTGDLQVDTGKYRERSNHDLPTSDMFH